MFLAVGLSSKTCLPDPHQPQLSSSGYCVLCIPKNIIQDQWPSTQRLKLADTVSRLLRLLFYGTFRVAKKMERKFRFPLRAR